MPYADTDFFLALLKPSDWLRKPAQRLLREHKGNTWTSGWTIVELMLIAKRFNLDLERVVMSVFELTEVRGINRDAALGASHLVMSKGMNVFDSLHAMTCGDDSIISSDKVFDEIGMKRIIL